MRVTPEEFRRSRAVLAHKVKDAERQRRRRLAGREALVHRCDQCGDWCFDQEPCATCAAVRRPAAPPIVATPVTYAQMAHRLGVTESQAHRWARSPANGFPAPVDKRMHGTREVPIYDWDEVVAWWVAYVPPGVRYVPDMDQEEIA